MKKLINDPSGLVREMLEARRGRRRGRPSWAMSMCWCAAISRRQAAARGRDFRRWLRSRAGARRLCRRGMLSAAVCGEVFTSPSTDAVLAAIRATAGPNGPC